MLLFLTYILWECNCSTWSSLSQIVAFWWPSVVKWSPKQNFWSPEKKKKKKTKHINGRTLNVSLQEGLVGRTVHLQYCHFLNDWDSFIGTLTFWPIIIKGKKRPMSGSRNGLLVLQKCWNQVIMFNTILVYCQAQKTSLILLSELEHWY